MWLRRRKVIPPEIAASENGFLEIAGRDAALPPREALVRFRDLVSAHMKWADSRNVRFRSRASYVKDATLTLAAASTVVPGIPSIPSRTAIALPMVAFVTLLNALEPFFSWRARWVLMEEGQYRLNRIRDEIDYCLFTTPAADIDPERLSHFFDAEQELWRDVSQRWVGFRRADQGKPTEPLDPP